MRDQRALDDILKSLTAYHIKEKDIVLTSTILGRGGFGIVILGEMGRSGRFGRRKGGALVAVKQLQATGTKTERIKLAEALTKELHVWAGLAHPNIIPLVGFDLDDSMTRAWLVSPYMKNGNISHYLSIHQPDMSFRLHIWKDIASGIAYLHSRNLCHGDIKGANVLVDDDNQVKLCDFGLTKLMESGTTAGTTSAGPQGTIRYMAPEFFSEERPMRSKQTDVWAWSCLGLEILFDLVPYSYASGNLAIMAQIVRGVAPLDLNDMDINEGTKQLFEQCWVAEPHKRISIRACCSALGDVLRRARAGIEPHWQELSRHAINHPERHKSLYTLGIALLDEYNKTGQAADLEEAIDLHRQALLLRRGDHPERHESLYILSFALWKKYRSEKNAAALTEAIRLYRQALELRPEGHQERNDDLHALAIALVDKYRIDGDSESLNEAIDLNRQSLKLRLEGHPERHESLHALAISLLDKYRKDKDNEALAEATDLHRQALQLRSEGHPDRHNSLHALATSLMDKYRKDTDFEALNEAIKMHRQALLLRPEGHPEREWSLRSLGVALESRLDGEMGSSDLLEAIDVYQQALRPFPTSHPQRQNAQTALDKLLLEQSRKTLAKSRSWDPRSLLARGE